MQMEHISGVAEMEKQCFSEPWSVQMFEGMLANASCTGFGAFEQEQLVGYGCVMCAAESADIITICTDLAFRKKGIGRALLEKMVACAWKKGCTEIFLEVRRGNIPAISLYGSLGFSQIGIRKNYYTSPQEDAVVMILKRENGA